MEWELRSDQPVYLQLVRLLKQAVLSGEYAPGSRVPSVRDLAAQAKVTPNTMQRALQSMEQSGLFETHRTSGRTVTQDVQKIEQLRCEQVQQSVQEFCRTMAGMGITANDMIALVEQCEQEGIFDGNNIGMR